MFGFFCDDLWKNVIRSCESAKIIGCIPLKSHTYFWLVSEIIGVEPTTFPSHMQNIVKTSKEWHMQSFDYWWNLYQNHICTPLYSYCISGLDENWVQWQCSLISALFRVCDNPFKNVVTTIWNCRHQNFHNSKIRNLLPACLRNNSHRTNHIPQLHAKYGVNWWSIVDVIVW